jgi:hypothetical protein
MTGNPDFDFSRRTFVKATGTVAGAGLLGAGVSATVASDETVDNDYLEFTNPRVRRASHAWARGYRGRANRSLALTDSGADSRHPDLGPWNGVVATNRDVITTNDQTLESDDGPLVYSYDYGDTDETTLDEETFTGTLAGPVVYNHSLDVPDGTHRITLDLAVEPSAQGGGQDSEDDLEVEVELNEGDRTEVAALRTETDRLATYDLVDVSEDYVASVGSLAGSGYYELTVRYVALEGGQPTLVDDVDPMAGLDRDDRPQLVGWNNDSTRYHYSRSPRDRNSHGTHVSGIMTGSGRGSAIDVDHPDTLVEEPQTELAPGETVVVEVTPDEETGVFGSAYGRNIEIVILDPDGEQVRRSRGVSGTSEESMVNNTAETPVETAGTYTVQIRASEGVPTPARLERVAVGAFVHHSETGGDATGEDLALHAGTGPGFSLFAVTNLGVGTELFAEYAQEYAETFNVRACNMSWGYVGGLPLGMTGELDSTPADIQALAEGGILSVTAAGNAATPANGNSSPAVANEAVSTVATGPLDGIASYSSGGLGGRDDESGEPYGKPDVTAIGGVLTDLDQAPIPGEPGEDAPYEDDENFGSERTYSGKGGTSMASPSACGIAGLVAQAMEEDGPEPIALPAPGEAGREDVLRLKSALLATASTTAFNAAPYHRAKAPTYTHGERDPYEGYGRVNAGAAVDAVSRELKDADTSDEIVGLNVPDVEQAVAGYVDAPGDYEVTVSFTEYGGEDGGDARGPPHLDLFVYDAVEPAGVGDGRAATGDPTLVTSDQGLGGEAAAAFSADPGDVHYVVVELVNVPGAFNGVDLQAHLDLVVEHTPRGQLKTAGKGRDGAPGDGGDSRADGSRDGGDDRADSDDEDDVVVDVDL